MKTLGLLLFLGLVGPGFFMLGFTSLRRSYWRESVPLLEVVIDHAVGTEPLPRTKWDRRFAYFQAWMMVFLGAFFSLCLVAVTISIIVPE